VRLPDNSSGGRFDGRTDTSPSRRPETAEWKTIRLSQVGRGRGLHATCGVLVFGNRSGVHGFNGGARRNGGVEIINFRRDRKASRVHPAVRSRNTQATTARLLLPHNACCPVDAFPFLDTRYCIGAAMRPWRRIERPSGIKLMVVCFLVLCGVGYTRILPAVRWNSSRCSLVFSRPAPGSLLWIASTLPFEYFVMYYGDENSSQRWSG
jgi:hypothetical protein